MYCYKDRTFCTYYKECEDGDKCGRALSDEDINIAYREKMPISTFAEKPDCFDKKI